MEDHETALASKYKIKKGRGNCTIFIAKIIFKLKAKHANSNIFS